MRVLIPCPHQYRELQEDEKFRLWDSHVKECLAKEQHISLDRRWVGKWFNWAGHLARLDPQRWALRAQRHRNVFWWNEQQEYTTGFRHHKRLGNISRWENVLCRHHPRHNQWEVSARSRQTWAQEREPFIDRVLGVKTTAPGIPPRAGTGACHYGAAEIHAKTKETSFKTRNGPKKQKTQTRSDTFARTPSGTLVDPRFPRH